MKKTILYTALLVLGAGSLASCQGDVDMPPVAEPVPGLSEKVGNGEWDKPLNAYQVRAGYDSKDANVWATGWIAGWIDTDANLSHTLDAVSATFTLPATVNSNLLLYPEPLPENIEDINWELCATVQLPSGKVRDALNLVNNPDVLGKQVSLYGTSGSKYCGQYGLRSCTEFNWGDKGFYIAPPVPPAPMPEVIENATFTKVTSLDQVVNEGQYLLVFNNEYMASPVEPASYSYGYLPVKSCTVTDGKITTSSVNAFIFYKEEDGWYLRDGYGRYVWRDSEHASFQLSALSSDEALKDNYLWKVTMTDDALFNIRNVKLNASIQYSASYGNVSSYSSLSETLPALYKLEK